ncbi:MAG: hypothetical protein U0694_09540 [Anaerolineae bacterium]
MQSIAVFGFLLALLVVGLLLRGRSRRLRIGGAVVVGMLVLAGILVLDALLTIGLFEYEVSESDPNAAERISAVSAHEAKYIWWLSLPPALRASCDTLTELCAMVDSYESYYVSLSVGGVMGIVSGGAVFLMASLRLSERKPVARGH